jgi:hypothetical protein
MNPNRFDVAVVDPHLDDFERKIRVSTRILRPHPSGLYFDDLRDFHEEKTSRATKFARSV